MTGSTTARGLPLGPRLGLCVAFAGCGAGAGGDDAPPFDAPMVDTLHRECTETIGDLSRPIAVRPVYVDYTGNVQPIEGGVGLIAPLQGGHVLMVGLDARNVAGCTATITGTLRDPGTGALIATEGRPTMLLVGADGWGRLSFPQTVTSTHLTTCPLNDLPRDIDGQTWRLELVLTDERGQSASWSGEVVPFCRPNAPDPAICPCQCDADFVFGEACPVDP